MVTGVAVIALLMRCGLARHPDVLAAIVRVESGGERLAIAVNGAYDLARQPRDGREAVAVARWLLEHRHSFDAGLAQVNSTNFPRLGLDAETAFEPCANLRAASVVLEECHARARAAGYRGEASWNAALSCYNTGHLSRGVANGYVAGVRAQLTPARTRNDPHRAAASAAASALRPREAFHSLLADAFTTAALSPR